MNIQILTPEEVIFKGEVEAVTVPGTEGEFQMLNNHAAIVSTLANGKIKLGNIISSSIKSEKITNEGKQEIFVIKGGVIEFNNNKAIILCD